MQKIFPIEDNKILPDLMGSRDDALHFLEAELEVRMYQDPQGLRLEGETEFLLQRAIRLLERLQRLVSKGLELSPQLLRYLLEASKKEDQRILTHFEPDCLAWTAKGRPLYAKTLGQKEYLEAIRKAEVTFAVGPAGTGKTFLAVAMAVQAFRNHEVDRIVLTRPAVEAGEKLGFLPGDLQMKVDPYMRPLYDALQELMGAEQYLKNQEKGLIEVSPLAYMRGRTLDHAFIILDEAQNTTPEQMKMFLTRIGMGSKVVVTGDRTQVDLTRDKKSGLEEALRILKNVPGIQSIELKQEDIVRNGIVQEILKAYDRARGKQVLLEQRKKMERAHKLKDRNYLKDREH